MSTPVEELLKLNWNDEALVNSRLVELSNLKPDGLQHFGQVWAKVEPGMRRQIISRLVELADENIELNYDSIFICCLKDTDGDVRALAIEGLWENEEATLINPLIDLLGKDGSEKVQSAAAIALGKFATLAELAKVRPEYIFRIEEALLGVFRNKMLGLEVRHLALEAVAPLNLPRVKKTIREAYQSADSTLKVSAVYAMGQNSDTCWMPMLLKELASTNGEMRYEAIRACGEIGEEEAIPHLAKFISGIDEDMALAAIEAISKIGGEKAKECLEEIVDSSEETLSQAARKSLEEMEAEEDLFRF
ncbi:MAG: HEAT repeat domain-containing protein [Chloroflexi bacterium]|nr:HEAT repeat domain-containing protein [Chloroflexota bacterium]